MDKDTVSLLSAREWMSRHGDLESFINFVQPFVSSNWPGIERFDNTAGHLWMDCYEVFTEFQFVFVKEGMDRPVAHFASIPLPVKERNSYPEEGWDWAMLLAHDKKEDNWHDYESLCALSLTIGKEFRGQGLARHCLKALLEKMKKMGKKRLLAPVRPSLKSKYPLTDIADYLKWQKGDQSFDPWMRVHQDLGGRMLNICHKAQHAQLSIATWEKEAQMRFPQSGAYLLFQGELNPIEIDLEKGIGTYTEPGVWFLHDLEK